MEIERKFLIGGFPADLPLLEQAVMEQGYLCTDPVVRIRSKESGGRTGYRLCFKGKGKLVRQETELDLTAEQFAELKNLLPAPLVRKEYRVYGLPGGERLECSLVDGKFYYAEVEFPTVEAAQAFTPPAFLGREVTQEDGFSMSDYWRTRRLPGLA